VKGMFYMVTSPRTDLSHATSTGWDLLAILKSVLTTAVEEEDAKMENAFVKKALQELHAIN
jgi:hypothetical protein